MIRPTRLKRRAGLGKANGREAGLRPFGSQGQEPGVFCSPSGSHLCMNTAAIVISFAAAFHFALGQVLTQFGLRHVSPLSGAAISIPTFTLVFICA